MTKLTIGEDGAALFDEKGRRVATLALVGAPKVYFASDHQEAIARRLALARQFAESGEVLAQRDELAEALRECLTVMHNEWHNKPRIGMEAAYEKARAALAKVPR